MIFSSIKSQHKKFLSQIPPSLHYSFTRDPPHFRMIKKMTIASHFYDNFIKLTTFRTFQYCIHNFDDISYSCYFSSTLPSFLSSDASRFIPHWILNLWCDLLYESNNAISMPTKAFAPSMDRCISSTSHRVLNFAKILAAVVSMPIGR